MDKSHTQTKKLRNILYTRPEPVAVLATTVGEAVPLDVAACNKLLSVPTGRVLNLKVLIANIRALPAKNGSRAPALKRAIAEGNGRVGFQCARRADVAAGGQFTHERAD
eukprot:6181204-Pleurochrysis_carterae.AAC.1